MLKDLAYSEFSQWMIVSPWAYPTFLTLHGLGMAFVVGLTVMIAIRILGFPEQLPLSAYARTIPLGIAAFVVNAISGTALFVADAVILWQNPSFQFKLVSIVVGLVVLWLMARGPLRKAAKVEATGESYRASSGDKAIAVMAILIWVAAVIVSGRLIAYLAPALF